MSSFENRVQKDLVTDNVFTESNEDFILPDYMPEIGRVLRLSSALLPEECYLGSDGAEFSGRIEYRLLYSDGEGNMTEAPLLGRYRYRIPMGEGGASVAYTDEKIESVSTRPTAPRKLNIRARISARPHLLREEKATPSLFSLVGEASAETLTETAEVLSRRACFSGVLHSEDRFTVEDGHPDDLTLLSVRGEVLPESAIASDGYLSVRGKLVTTLLLKKDGGSPFLKVFAQSFEEEIAAEDCRMGDGVTLRAFCGAPAVSFEEEGDATAVLLDMEYSLSGVIYRGESISYLKDVYLHGAHAEVGRHSLDGESLVGCFTGNFTVAGDAPLSSDFKCEGKCLYPTFSLKESNASLLDGRCIIEGTLAVSLLALSTDENERCELSFPFRVELPLGAMTHAEDTVQFSVVPVGGTASLGTGVVRLSTELAVSACARRPYTVSLPVSVIKVAESERRDGSTVIVYFPTDEDTLWSVGKRYGIPLSELQKQNGIPTDGDTDADSKKSLDGYAYLLIG